MNDGARAKLDAALAECDLHAQVLTEAAKKLPPRFDPNGSPGLQTETRAYLDQTAYRFMKLQDSLGEKVMPGLLSATLDPLPPDDATFAEKLQRLERLGALPSVTAWRLLREVRNSLAHEYPDHSALQAQALNRLMAGVQDLLSIWLSVRTFAETRLG